MSKNQPEKASRKLVPSMRGEVAEKAQWMKHAVLNTPLADVLDIDGESATLILCDPVGVERFEPTTSSV